MIEFECSCDQKRHSAPVDFVEISKGAIEKIPEILEKFNKIYMICDKNTYNAAGKRVEKLLSDSGKLFSKLVIEEENVLPNEYTIGKILLNVVNPSAKADIRKFSPLPDFFLAVGSGTVNDSTRVVSYRLGIPYGICATAPSMDGYLSAGSPIVHDLTKSTVQCTTPRYLIADLDVLKDAPIDMLYAGIGDMFGKYTGMLDWELARDFTGEYYCEKIAGDVMNATNKCLENGYKIKDREPECIKNIMEGFMVTGLGMAYTGNSRPASGSEHIIAHSWELFDILEGKKPNLHGLEVCEATVLVGIMYKKLLKETDDEKLKELIAKYIPYFDSVEKFCREMKMPYVVTDYDRVVDGIKKALVLRDRYTILFYLRDKGMFDRYAKECARELIEFINA